MSLKPSSPSAADPVYDVVVVGAGASGSALAYTLARYTDIPRLALIEKYASVGSVNSHAKNNSQTLHVGDIETNYPIQKVREVYPAAMMVKRYTDSLPEVERTRVIKQVQKMVLAVGRPEVEILEKRHRDLLSVFPHLERLDGSGIAERESAVMRGRRIGEPVLALFNPEGYAVDYGALAQSLVDSARRERGALDVFLGTEVLEVKEDGGEYVITAHARKFRARVVVFDTDAYSLLFAKRLGYGKEFSLIPIAGSFYFTPKTLQGKVYRVQDPRMPFAAVHGDPELTLPDKTRWGPTARFYPVLEARRLSTMIDFFRSSGFGRLATWMSFASILLEPIRFWYLIRNFFYDLPIIGTYLILPQLKKIVPSLRWSDISRAPGFGGMRLQRVDTRERTLLLGEGKIIGKNIIFNMTPSPGASVSLYNAMRDAETIAGFLPTVRFDKERMLSELCVTRLASSADVSLTDTYAS